MSVDIRYVTNGTVTGYYVRNAMDETINFYDSIDKVPESLRSRAEKKALTYWGPDISGLMGIRNVLYPDFPKCYHPDYAGETCVAESCRYSPNGDWTLCPYFNGGGEEMINLREDTSLIVCAVRYALGRESYISHTVPAEVKLILPQVTDGILAALRTIKITGQPEIGISYTKQL